MKILDLLEKTIDNRGKTPPVADDGNCLLEINCIAGKDKYPDYSLVKKHVTAETYNTWFRSGHPQKGDILIPTVGTLDAISMMDRDDCCIAQNLVAFRSNPKICDSEFLYYLLCDPTVRTRVLQLDIGAVQPSIKVPHLKKLEVRIPALEKQKKIACVLNIFDKKIAINKKVNKNLSDQIQAIYCNKFDPVTHTPSGRLSDICKYSSDRIPVSELTVSTYYSTENMQPNKAGAVNATSLPSIQQTTRCHKGDVLISNIRPYFKKIVYVTEECGCSTDVLCFTPKKSELTAFLFGTLYIDRFFEHMVTGSKGTKMPRGDKQQIMNYPIVIPSEESLKAYNKVIIPMLEQVSYNREENIRLAALRDTLLPRLMSGEIDVSNLDI